MTCLALVVVLQAVTFTTIARGPSSQIQEPRTVIIRTAVDWQALWTGHAGDVRRPAVDFSKVMVAGVFLGTRPSAGYSVEITAVTRTGTSAIVEYRERQPGPDQMTAQVLTAPFHLVTIPRDIERVQFWAIPVSRFQLP